jgi:hypothetical protein
VDLLESGQPVVVSGRLSDTAERCDDDHGPVAAGRRGGVPVLQGTNWCRSHQQISGRTVPMSRVTAQARNQRLRAEAALCLLWAQIHPEVGELRDRRPRQRRPAT